MATAHAPTPFGRTRATLSLDPRIRRRSFRRLAISAEWTVRAAGHRERDIPVLWSADDGVRLRPDRHRRARAWPGGARGSRPSFASGTIRDAINFHLKPAPIVVLDATQVADDFHARFSARQRQYRYRILNRHSPPAYERGRLWWVPIPLDAERMARAAAVLVGHHDFTSFRSTMCQAETPVKTLDSLTVRHDGAEIRIEARARSFLHNQVRIIAGSLKLVGEGKWSTAHLAEVLEARDRVRAGPTAPAHGLCLVSVSY